MIEGLKIEVSGEELKRIAQARAEYHVKRAEFYRDQAASLKEGLDEAARESPKNYTSNDPVRDLVMKEKDHGRKQRYFQFLADHVVVGDTYRLVQKDLGDLEITDQW